MLSDRCASLIQVPCSNGESLEIAGRVEPEGLLSLGGAVNGLEEVDGSGVLALAAEDSLSVAAARTTTARRERADVPLPAI
jgi:hypothetical protein